LLASLDPRSTKLGVRSGRWNTSDGFNSSVGAGVFCSSSTPCGNRALFVLGMAAMGFQGWPPATEFGRLGLHRLLGPQCNFPFALGPFCKKVGIATLCIPRVCTCICTRPVRYLLSLIHVCLNKKTLRLGTITTNKDITTSQHDHTTPLKFDPGCV